MTTMIRGKQICNQLKAVRQRIADENGIPFSVRECTHKGECRGTCPRCEAEVRYLEQALAQRISLGKAATVAGLTLSLTACGGGGEPTLRVDTPRADTVPTPLCDTVAVDTTEPPDPTIDAVLSGIVGGDFLLENDDVQPGDSIPKQQAQREEDLVEGMINETPAVFPGGEDALYKFLGDNIVHPKEHGCSVVKGTVVVVFDIEKDGSITNARILRDIGEGYGEAVLKVVNAMPKWKPGEVDGKPVRQQFSLPVQFNLD